MFQQPFSADELSPGNTKRHKIHKKIHRNKYSDQENHEVSKEELENKVLLNQNIIHSYPDSSITKFNEKMQLDLEELMDYQNNLANKIALYFPAYQGCRSVEEFQCLNRIEEGTYGVVYRAKNKKTGELVALKRLKMEKEKEGFPITSLREINTLMKAHHPNVVSILEIVVGSNMDKIYIVMEFVEHDLKSLMETMKQSFLIGEVKTLLLQLLRGVHHLHDNWILHRDIKASNILLSHAGILKLGDFGLAREYGSPLKPYTPIVVTLWYRAPELLLGTPKYSTAIDLWSVGCLFGELLTLKPLFQGKSEMDQLNKIYKDLGTPNQTIWPDYNNLPMVKKINFVDYPYNNIRKRFTGCLLSDSGFDLLNKLLTYDPEVRFTAEQGLNHAFFQESPLPINPALLPTYPAKSEMGGLPSTNATNANYNNQSQNVNPHHHVKHSPRPPSGGKQYDNLMASETGEHIYDIPDKTKNADSKSKATSSSLFIPSGQSLAVFDKAYEESRLESEAERLRAQLLEETLGKSNTHQHQSASQHQSDDETNANTEEPNDNNHRQTTIISLQKEQQQHTMVIEVDPYQTLLSSYATSKWESNNANETTFGEESFSNNNYDSSLISPPLNDPLLESSDLSKKDNLPFKNEKHDKKLKESTNNYSYDISPPLLPSSLLTEDDNIVIYEKDTLFMDSDVDDDDIYGRNHERDTMADNVNDHNNIISLSPSSLVKHARRLALEIPQVDKSSGRKHPRIEGTLAEKPIVPLNGQESYDGDDLQQTTSQPKRKYHEKDYINPKKASAFLYKSLMGSKDGDNENQETSSGANISITKKSSHKKHSSSNSGHDKERRQAEQPNVRDEGHHSHKQKHRRHHRHKSNIDDEERQTHHHTSSTKRDHTKRKDSSDETMSIRSVIKQQHKQHRDHSRSKRDNNNNTHTQKSNILPPSAPFNR